MGLFDEIENHLMKTKKTEVTEVTEVTLSESLDNPGYKNGHGGVAEVTLPESLRRCPLQTAGLLCHAYNEGRCNSEPGACNVANGMRKYIEEHLSRDQELSIHRGEPKSDTSCHKEAVEPHEN